MTATGYKPLLNNNILFQITKIAGYLCAGQHNELKVAFRCSDAAPARRCDCQKLRTIYFLETRMDEAWKQQTEQLFG